MEDQPADSGDLTTGEPDKPRRRMRFGRRGRAETVVPEPETTDSPERPTPTGKSARKAAAAEPEGEPDLEAQTEGQTEGEPETQLQADAEPLEREADAETEPAADAETEPAAEPVLVAHRPAGKRLTYAAAGAAAVFVAAAGLAGAMAQPYLVDRALVATKLDVAQTSADAITTLWTYNPDDIETLPDRAARYLSNDFADQYRKFIDSIAPTNKQAQVTNNTQVMGTAVETISRDEATAIVYTNSVSTSPVTKNIPSLRYLSYRLTLHRSDGDWRITQMPALTQLDLSPQL